MELYAAGKVDEILTESADRAQQAGNDAWEIEAARVLRRIKREAQIAGSEAQASLSGSQRFELIADLQGGRGIFRYDDTRVPLTPIETKAMAFLSPRPNVALPVDEINDSIGGTQRYAERTMQDLFKRLKNKLGPKAFIRSEGVAVFLPAHLGDFEPLPHPVGRHYNS